MTRDAQGPVRIPLTEDQRRQVFAVTGKDACAIEVGSESEDDDWVILVVLPDNNESLEQGRR